MTKKMLIRWAALIALIAVLAYLFVQLGEWQLRRLDERRHTNAVVVEHAEQDPVPYQRVMDKVITDDDQWQVVTVTGEYTGETYQARYRNQDGPGTEAVSPMRADDGRTVLISRGFIPRPQGQPDPAPPAPPTGEVTVTGYVHRDERGKDEAIVPHEFNIRLINSEAIGKDLGTELVNGYVAAFESSPTDDALLEPISLPPLDEGPHQSYAWQWFAFAVMAVIGVGFLIRADIKDHRKTQARLAARQAKLDAAQDVPESDSDAAPAPAAEPSDEEPRA